ncbi:MAG: hypothetical protein ISS38_01040 [Candidatus Cloacimonetes bacterium]|nr:hypothetical protein [Candidatus Cloacimonadota bacterium]
MIVIFLFACFVVFCHLFGYILLLFVISKFKRIKNNKLRDIKPFPTITVLCPAYNEEEKIEEKIKS